LVDSSLVAANYWFAIQCEEVITVGLEVTSRQTPYFDPPHPEKGICKSRTVAKAEHDHGS